MEYKLISKSEKETKELANKIGTLVKPKQVILLDGDLGAGKTTFTKGLALGMGVSETVNSPTFNIVKCYFKGRLPLFHIDAYRLEGNKQDIGLDEYIYGNGVSAIEWSIFIDYLIPKEYLKLEIRRIDENIREIKFTAIGKQSEDLLKDVIACQ